MTHLTKSLIALGIVLCAPCTQALAASDPTALYGGDIEFDVVRKGKTIGHAVTQFSRKGDELLVRSDMSLKVKAFLFFSYKMTYQSDAIWRDGRMVELKVDGKMGGDALGITGQQDGDGFAWHGPAGDVASPTPIMPTNHWNTDVLDETEVLNTLTGKLNTVSITRRELEMVETGSGPRPAYRYVYDGDLQNEVWYDEAGRWVKLRFEGTDGSTIEYICRQCGGDAS